MVASRGRGLRPGGFLRELLRLVVLVGLGFGAGLLFGVVTEEPALLAGHLRGESDSVELAAVAAAGPVAGPEVPASAADERAGPDDPSDHASAEVGTAGAKASTRSGGEEVGSSLLARLPSKPPPARVVPVAERPSSRAPLAPVVRDRREASDGDRSEWSIQVGAFADEAAARRLADSLRDDYPVAVLQAGGDGKRWRVRVQPVRGEQQARTMAEGLKRDEGLPTWLTPLDRR